ncbi:arsenate reductase family protein [Apibacter raozihei]|uniref:arsenate reductase family protein n=1 Tax=Apibacter raozihei TaxID=2500547 RepID=UPI000FE2C67F|nr:arsenate reductase family protein [Apibacter raozihei]
MSKIHIVCYPNCSTCKKALKWLDEHNLEFEERNIAIQNPSESELKSWKEKSNYPLSKFFNTSGKVYKELNLKDKVKEAKDEELYSLLASNGMLVKRPLLVTDSFVLVGFKPEEWEDKLL